LTNKLDCADSRMKFRIVLTVVPR